MTKSMKVQMHEGTRSTCVHVYIPRYINVRYDFVYSNVQVISNSMRY